MTAVVLVVALVACGGRQESQSAPTSPSIVEPLPTDDTTTEPATEPPQTESPEPLDEVEVDLERVAQVDSPTALAVRSGDAALYVAQRAGTVRAVRNGDVDGDPVLDITGDVSTGAERGLLGLAFSTDGDVLYVSYTDPDGHSRVDAVDMDGTTADGGARRNLITVEQPFGNHNGGNVVVGPDGMLYLGLGDGGSAGDPQGNGQNADSLLGSLLRLDPDDGSAPDDNPFVDGGGARRAFATGLRNPWRFSFDRETDDLWIADVGQDRIEEINVVSPDDAAGANYGWNIFEGSESFQGGDEPDGYVGPVYEYPTREGCAVTGGFVYRGGAIPELQGAYLFSDFCAGRIQGLRVDGGEVVDEADLGISSDNVVSFGEDADGELYVLSLGGAIDRIVGA